MAVAASLFFSKSAFANVPIGAAAFLVYPTIAYTESIVALIIKIAVESLVFNRMTKFDIIQSFFVVIIANVASSLFGFIILAAFSFGAAVIIMLLPLAWGLSRMFKFSSSKINIYTNTAKYSFLIFIVIMLVCDLSGLTLLPLTDVHMNRLFKSPDTILTAACTIAMFLIGFLFTLVTETYAVVKYSIRKNIILDRTTVKAVVIMNLVSYIILSILYGEAIIRYVFKMII